jgi:hypothetical protein
MKFSKTTLFSIAGAAIASALFAVGCSNPEDQPVAGHDKPGAPRPTSIVRQQVDRQAPISQPGHKIGFQAAEAVFSARCMPCHNSTNKKGGVDLSSYDGLMASTYNGEKLIKGRKVGDSAIYKAVIGAKPIMPKDAKPLATDDLSAISSWIYDGARNN